MVPELGHFALLLALFLALIQMTLVFFSKEKFFLLTCYAAYGQFFFLSFSFSMLIISFIFNDVTLPYVLHHSNKMLSFIYRIGAAWGGHEGSLLLWCLILSTWNMAFILLRDKLMALHSYQQILAILGFLNAGFIIFLLTVSNPFLRIYPTSPVTGDDLTAVLQDISLIFHPPVLYAGYVGLSIAFAFCLSALWRGKVEDNWARICRFWVLLPWSFLSAGIVFGSLWAYRELGWGGFWFWDPVENASLMPWLLATALFHSLIVVEKRKAFLGWTILLGLLAFSLSLIGTFLVRSGVLVSVHAFANDPKRGVFLLTFLSSIMCGSFLLYALRVKVFYRPFQFHLWSREFFLLLNSIFLLTFTFTVLLGTLYPIILETLTGEKISVGEPYFNTVFLPLTLPLLFLMGALPYISWQPTTFFSFIKKSSVIFSISLFSGLFIPWFLGFPFKGLSSIGLILTAWLFLATVWEMLKRLCMQKNINLAFFSMITAHLGIALLSAGIVMNKSYSEEKQFIIAPFETVTLAGYALTFIKEKPINSVNYNGLELTFAIYQNKKFIALLTTEERFYLSHEETFNRPGILINPFRDIYLALNRKLTATTWSIRVYYKPMVRFIWGGGLLCMFGGLLSCIHYLVLRFKKNV